MLPPQVVGFLSNERYLAWWLVIVAAMRAFSTVTGFVAPAVLAKGVFNRGGAKTPDYNPLVGRTFAVWTLVSGAAALFTAANLHNTAVVWFAVVTFGSAFLYFVVELLAGSVSVKTAASPGFVSSALCRDSGLPQAGACAP